MSGQQPVWERPESLRERALWYRAFAGAHGDAAWALRLAALLERQADAIEAEQASQARPKAEPDEPA